MKEKRLLFSVTIADCEVQTFTCGSKGGQHANRNETGVRITHPPSGATAEARDNKSQIQNKRSAWVRMCRSPKFQKWHAGEVQRRLREAPVERTVDEMMRSENILVERRDATGRWVDERLLADTT